MCAVRCAITRSGTRCRWRRMASCTSVGKPLARIAISAWMPAATVSIFNRPPAASPCSIGTATISHGRCGFYRAVEPVRTAYPRHASRMEAMGFDMLPTPKADRRFLHSTGGMHGLLPQARPAAQQPRPLDRSPAGGAHSPAPESHHQPLDTLVMPVRNSVGATFASHLGVGAHLAARPTRSAGTRAGRPLRRIAYPYACASSCSINGRYTLKGGASTTETCRNLMMACADEVSSPRKIRFGVL